MMDFCVWERELDLKITSVDDSEVEAAGSVANKIGVIMTSHSALDLLSKVFAVWHSVFQ